MNYSNYANMNKQTAYKEIVANYDAARTLLYERKLAYGESAIVPFYYPDRTSPVKTVELMEGVGSVNGEILINCNVLGSNVKADDSVVTVPDSSTELPLRSVIADIYQKIYNDSSVYGALMSIKESLDANGEKLDKISASIDKLFVTEVVK